MALRAMDSMRLDFGLFCETKLTHEMYTKDCCGYRVYATKAKSAHQGGVALFYRPDSPLWTIEGIRSHGPNTISCLVVSGNRRWNLVGSYIPPSEDSGETLQYIGEAIRTRCNHPIIFMGDINVDLLATELSARDEEIATALALHGLNDVSQFFRRPHYGRWTWSQRREDQFLQSTTDWILAENPLDIARWTIKMPRYYHSDHRLVLGELHLTTRRRHRRYINSRQHLPIFIPRPLTRVDQMFEDLCKYRRRQSGTPHTQRDRSWIAADTWQLIDRRTSLRRLQLFRSMLQTGQINTEQVFDYDLPESQRVLSPLRSNRATAWELHFVEPLFPGDLSYTSLRDQIYVETSLQIGRVGAEKVTNCDLGQQSSSVSTTDRTDEELQSEQLQSEQYISGDSFTMQSEGVSAEDSMQNSQVEAEEVFDYDQEI